MEDYMGCMLVDFEEFEKGVDDFGGFGRDLCGDCSCLSAFLVTNFEILRYSS